MTKEPEYIEKLPDGWFVLDVMRTRGRGWDWTALVVDVDPDEWAGERDVPPRQSPTASAWLRIPGKHRSRDAAYDALEEMLETRH